MKYVLIIPDGAADEPQAAVDGLTPLQAARTPAMDEIGKLRRGARIGKPRHNRGRRQYLPFHVGQNQRLRPVEDAALADRMRAFVSQQIAASQRITVPLHKRRATLWNRIRWNVSWFLVTVMDYNVSRGLNLGL